MLGVGGATPLMYACQQCRENEVLEILKKQPNSLKDRDRTLKTPLHYCAENPNSSCAEVLLKAAPDLVNAQDENGYCILHLAVIAGNKPLIKLLISKGANVNIHDNEGHSAVHWAIVSSEKEALETIIRAGANPSTPDIHGGYPLHYAVQMCGSSRDYVRGFEDTVRVVETLLNFGVDVNVKDKDGRQPILWAASAGSADAVIHLVSGGACIEAADKDGLTALHCAASRGHTTTLETLISLCGANVDVIDGNGCSALFYSVTLGHADATELLLQLGAEPNRQDRKGRTPAHCGAAKGQLETLRILHKHGGNLWMRNVKGDIPLHEAVASGRKDLVLWLLSQRSEAINIANNDGRCPLHIASMYNNTEMVKVLLDSKSLVNPVMRTSKGVLMTPLNVALSKGHRSCGKYLQLHGGVPFSKVSKLEPASGFSLRISPSDDMMIVTDRSEKSKDLATSPQSKILKSRSSTDLQEPQEIIRTESSDKKKVYRRRKKKKSTSNLHTQESDSDDSIRDVKTQEKRKSGNSNEDDTKNYVENEQFRSKDIHLDVKSGKKNPKAGVKTEEHVTVTKTTGKTESKSRQKNKSFNETKNVSHLSPDDFPPGMQTINQLDIVIMEPGEDTTKPESQRFDSIPSESSTETKQEEITERQIKKTTVDGGVVVKEKESATKEGEMRKESGFGKSSKGKNPSRKVRNNETGQKSSEDDVIRKSVKSPKTEGSDEYQTVRSRDPKPDAREKFEITANSDVEKSEMRIKDEQKEQKKSENGNVLEEKSQSNSEINSEKEVAESENVVTGAEESKISNDLAAEGPVIDGDVKMEENALVESSSPKENIEESLELKQKEMEEINFVGSAESEVKTEINESKVDEERLLTDPLRLLEKKILENSVVKSEIIAHKTSDTESKPTILSDEPIAEDPSHDVTKGSVEKSEGDDPSERKNGKLSSASDKKASAGVEINTFVNENKSSAWKREPSSPEDSKVLEVVEINPSSAGKSKPEGSEKINTRAAEESKLLPTEDNINKKGITINLPPEENPPENSEEDTITAAGEEEVTKDRDASPEERRKTTALEHRHCKTPRVSRLCRRDKDFKDDTSQVSVTQLVQNTIRKYHMERGIFYQLLELKRYQIRSGKANEQVLVKRLADEYERSRIFLGMKPFTGLYRFREFEKFLYDQLKALNSRRGFIDPEVKFRDDIDVLSGFLKKSRYKIINEMLPSEKICTCITQRCHHSACAYTSVPCSAYITDLRRHRHRKPKKESFFPRLLEYKTSHEVQKYKERPATLELIQGSEKHVVTLPQHSPARGKRYYVTFTIKGGPGFKGDDDADDSRVYLKHRHAKSV